MFTLFIVFLFVILVATATGLNCFSVRMGRKIVLVGVATLIVVFGGGCSSPKKCLVPGCAGLHRGVWEMDHQLVAQKIKAGEVKISVAQWMEARETTTPDLKGWKDDDLHLQYYLKGYMIEDQRKAGWEDRNIFLSDSEIMSRLD